jgi:hypothetical protein
VLSPRLARSVIAALRRCRRKRAPGWCATGLHAWLAEPATADKTIRRASGAKTLMRDLNLMARLLKRLSR